MNLMGQSLLSCLGKASVCSQIKHAVLFTDNLNARDYCRDIGPVLRRREVGIRPCLKTDFGNMGSFRPVFPPRNVECGASDGEGRNLFSVCLYGRGHYKVVPVQRGYSSHDDSASIPVHNSDHQLVAVLEVFDCVHSREAITNDKIRLPLLFPQLKSDVRDRAEASKAAEPPAERSKPTLQIAIVRSAKGNFRPGCQFRQKAHEQNKHAERQRGQHRHTKSLVAHSDTPKASRQLRHDSVGAFNAAWAGGAA